MVTLSGAPSSQELDFGAAWFVPVQGRISGRCNGVKQAVQKYGF